MTTRRTLFAAAALLPTVPSSFAAAPVPFDQPAFDAAQAAGRPVLAAITAPWCPIRKAQKPILARLGTGAHFGSLAIFEIDFDTQKVPVHRFDARSRSTPIVFKGGDEVGRSVDETQPEWSGSFREKAL